MKYCSICGKEMQDDMKFCPYCGKSYNFDDNNAEESSNQKTICVENRPKKKHGAIKAILIIFLTIFVIMILSLMFGTSEDAYIDPYDGMSVEEFINSCYEVEYTELARYPEKYEGEHIKISGQIIQALEYGNYCEYRISMDKNYGDVVYGIFVRENGGARVLENDYVTIYGLGQGLITYESTAGLKITIPEIRITTIEYSE